MEDIIVFNTCDSERDLNDYRGLYNIFMLNKKNLATFVHGDSEFSSSGGSLVVWPKNKPCDDIYYPDQLDADVVLVSDYFLDLYRPETVWDSIGRAYFRHFPVLYMGKSFSHEWTCLEIDFQQIRRHFYMLQTYQGEDIIGTLLRSLLYDIWAVISKLSWSGVTDNLPSWHFAQFLMDVQQNCRTHRDVAWYAKKQDLTPKYLTEISNYATDRPAGDWIDERAARILRRELSAEVVSLTDLAAEMNFSSLPAFTRYVKRVLGCSPSEFRSELEEKYPDI